MQSFVEPHFAWNIFIRSNSKMIDGEMSDTDVISIIERWNYRRGLGSALDGRGSPSHIPKDIPVIVPGNFHPTEFVDSPLLSRRAAN